MCACVYILCIRMLQYIHIHMCQVRCIQNRHGMKSSPFECDTYPSSGTAVHCFISWGSTHSGVWPLGPLGS